MRGDWIVPTCRSAQLLGAARLRSPSQWAELLEQPEGAVSGDTNVSLVSAMRKPAARGAFLSVERASVLSVECDRFPHTARDRGPISSGWSPRSATCWPRSAVRRAHSRAGSCDSSPRNGCLTARFENSLTVANSYFRPTPFQTVVNPGMARAGGGGARGEGPEPGSGGVGGGARLRRSRGGAGRRRSGTAAAPTSADRCVRANTGTLN